MSDCINDAKTSGKIAETPASYVLYLSIPGLESAGLFPRIAENRGRVPVSFIGQPSDAHDANGQARADVSPQKNHPDAHAIRRRLKKLTRRELDLLKLVLAGKPDEQIALDLDMSIKTVAKHRAKFMAKTQALNAAE